jgi:hypothetical protein
MLRGTARRKLDYKKKHNGWLIATLGKTVQVSGDKQHM